MRCCLNRNESSWRHPGRRITYDGTSWLPGADKDSYNCQQFTYEQTPSVEADCIQTNRLTNPKYDEMTVGLITEGGEFLEEEILTPGSKTYRKTDKKKSRTSGGKTVVVPIHTGGGESGSGNNHRGVSLMSLTAELYESILEKARELTEPLLAKEKYG